MKLILRNIKKEFNLIDVLKGCDFEFESGKIYGLLGRNGAGKTTLFNIIYSELEKDSGEILLEQEGVVDVVNPRDVGMVFAETFLPAGRNLWNKSKTITGWKTVAGKDVQNQKIDETCTIDYAFKVVEIVKDDTYGYKATIEITKNA